MHICKEEKLPYFILGNGSNLLVSDEGFRGSCDSDLQEYESDSGRRRKDKRAGRGIVVSNCQKSGSGTTDRNGICLEESRVLWGGAAVMNAGAYGGEMKDILESVTVLTGEGEILVLESSQLHIWDIEPV